MTMVERAVIASDKAGDAYIATLPERLDQRPPGWRRTLATARMSAALQAALDGNDEDLVLICFNAMHDEWGVEENARAAIAALRAAALGDETP